MVNNMNTSNKAFEEWYKTCGYSGDYSEAMLSRAWNASRNNAIDDAVKVAEGLAEGELRDTAFAAYTDAANKIKELKQ